MTYHEAKRTLKALDMKIQRTEYDEYRVNYFRRDHEATAYYTNDLDDAVETGKRMSADNRREPLSDTQIIADAIAAFPARFGLRAYSGVFRISVHESYVSDGRVVLYIQRQTGAQWECFDKCSAGVLRTEIMK